MDYFLGLDLGQQQDYTAMALTAPVEEPEGTFDYFRMEPRKVRRVRVLHLEQMRLGTPYLNVVRRVREVTRRPELRGRCTVVADASGVGMPVVEMLRAADLKATVVPVVITGAETANRTGDVWRVPRHELLARLRLELERGRLKVPRAWPESALLEAELKAVRAGRSAPGLGGAHDDLVFALALAVWKARPVSW